MIPLIGYPDRLSVRPGEALAFKVSSACDAPYGAELIRVISADPNPAGAGIRDVGMADVFSGEFPSRPQSVALGSSVHIPEAEPLRNQTALTFVATIWPTRPYRREQVILSYADESGSQHIALMIGADQSIAARMARQGEQAAEVSVGHPLKERTWYRVWATFDLVSGRLSVGQQPLGDVFATPSAGTAEADTGAAWAAPPSGTLSIAALAGASASGHFNGKIEAPAIFSRVLSGDEAIAAASGQAVDGVLASWDFSKGIDGLDVTDNGPHELHGSIINLPTRAMTGAAWSGHETCWRHAPEQYAAIHFHDDDLFDCAWETDFTFTLPEDLRSGVYAMRLTCGEHVDTIPFFVCPPKGRPNAKLCVIIPTFTYIIYANHARPDADEAWHSRVADWNAYPHNPLVHRDFALSTYNYHTDKSGICYTTSQRPIISMRCGYLTFASENGSGLRHFQADTHLITWLETKGYDYDVVTDMELHREGVDVLASYDAVLTTSHPEYHTAETLDALQAYRDQGGRFCYLGGNGFYWKVAMSDAVPGVIEIRRAEGGLRAWAAEPGEYFNALDGGLGGLWRRSGRPPQKLAGIGFTAQGNFVGSYYRRNEAGADPRAAWMFAGIDDEIIGDFGLSGGGAAGYELDRADVRLGTPGHALVVATSENHTHPDWMLVPEEHLTHITNWPGEPLKQLIRADMTFFETPNNGAVFAVGSITFCGALPVNDCDNNISALLTNVVDRFLDPGATFEVPG